jgi:hypothetical protein
MRATNVVYESVVSKLTIVIVTESAKIIISIHLTPLLIIIERNGLRSNSLLLLYLLVLHWLEALLLIALHLHFLRLLLRV